MLLLILISCKSDEAPPTSSAEDTGIPIEQGFSRLDEVFEISSSAYFGVTSALKPRDSQTYYQVSPPWQDNGDDLVQAWFDIGNNSLLAEIDVGGRIEYPVVRGPLSGFAQGSENYQNTDFLAGSPWSFTLDVGSGPIALDRVDGTSVEMLGDRLFQWKSTIDNLAVSFVPFAPSDGQLATPQPRALIAAFQLENTGDTPLTITLAAPYGVPDADHLEQITEAATIYGPAPYAGANHTNDKNWIPRFAEVGYAVAGYEAVLLLDDAAEDNTQITLTLAPYTARVIPFGLMVGGGVEELAYTRDQLRSRTPVDWLNGAWGRLDTLLGTLNVPDDPYIPELMARYAMVADDGFLFDGTGRLHHDHGGSWVLMGMIAPEYLSALLPGGDMGVSCPPSEAMVRWSLYGTTLPPILAAEVYQWSGEATNYGDGSVFETQYRCLVDAILDTQYPGVTLFPSSYIWDGPSRGDYHTGSNIAVWYMLKAGARFAETLWADSATAAAWSAKADAVREALLSHNVLDSWFDERFVEGAWADGHIDGDVTSHDGEEIMVAEAPIFDFIASDDPRRIRHGIAAMSTENGFYASDVSAMYWGDASPVTAPGWLTALSGAADADAQRRALDLWRRHTDVDGSMYWWPYDFPATDPNLIRRRMSFADTTPYDFPATDPNLIRRRMSFADTTPIDTAKVDYATSNALALLIYDVFGLSGDVPERRVLFRPNVPWSRFDWSNAPVGAARFDVSYVDDGQAVTATLVNRTSVTWAATVEAVVPQGMVADASVTGRWYGRDSLAQSAQLAPGARLSVTLPYTDEAMDLCVAAAWTRLVDAGGALGDWQQLLWADADNDDLPEGWAFRLLVEAQCADPAVEARWSENWARCAGLGWGDDWATVCASYATLSEDAVGMVNLWNGQVLGLQPFMSGGEEPLSGDGDFDVDGVSNLDEFMGNGGAEGSRVRFAEKASGG